MRYRFGGTMPAWWVTTADATAIFGTGVRAVVLSNETIALEVFNAPNGTRITDLLDETGTPVTTITVPAGRPYIQPVDGPDGVLNLWVQASDGTWLPMPRFDLGAPAHLDSGGKVPVAELPVGSASGQVAAGNHTHPHMIRHVGPDAPNTTGWSYGDLWYDTSTEG